MVYYSFYARSAKSDVLVFLIYVRVMTMHLVFGWIRTIFISISIFLLCILRAVQREKYLIGIL